ncbi:hypothetical protein LWP59_33905 [Amycolatopsis acidiphila]|uniref:Uncharacterized protein n=1 Tax=Amycolatopsis acidiphila TaxID=715473 RepID=A0A558A8X7_9PSEU|nr:hypothetical protein [Amycolatopsis acidiphila]TVT20714.1 hypothetical protein FNH06_19560 [Amycolatopsis acidiphila]UIJ59016.1 hypothetical protein LWP59_33905 [Amycolatopsis acidiphila]GHG73365.1 hypothetical protein GCM10017788_36650 [Amycolatopsis acidiphila]
MTDLSERLRRLDRAVDTETAALLDRKAEDVEAISQLARIGRHLLELGACLLAEVPDIDLDDLDTALIGIVAATLDQPGGPHRRRRELRLGGLTIRVTAERTCGTGTWRRK